LLPETLEIAGGIGDKSDRARALILTGLVGLRQKTNQEKPQPQSPLGTYFEKPKIAETQIYQ